MVVKSCHSDNSIFQILGTKYNKLFSPLNKLLILRIEKGEALRMELYCITLIIPKSYVIFIFQKISLKIDGDVFSNNF